MAQGAPTHVTEHAVRPIVSISLAPDEDTSSLHVVDTTAGPAKPGSAGTGSHRLIGMRERALVVGGSARAGPDGRDRYEVLLTIPLTPWRGEPVPR